MITSNRKAERYKTKDGQKMIRIYCLACDDFHSIPIGRPNGIASKRFNNNLKLPSVTLSFNKALEFVKYEQSKENLAKSEVDRSVEAICEFRLNRGSIAYTQRCTHKGSGIRVPLPDIQPYLNKEAINIKQTKLKKALAVTGGLGKVTDEAKEGLELEDKEDKK